jgi:hypothetical protein
MCSLNDLGAIHADMLWVQAELDATPEEYERLPLPPSRTPKHCEIE